MYVGHSRPQPSAPFMKGAPDTKVRHFKLYCISIFRSHQAAPYIQVAPDIKVPALQVPLYINHMDN